MNGVADAWADDIQYRCGAEPSWLKGSSQGKASLYIAIPE